MTFQELENNISRLKLPYIECNLFSPELVPGAFQNEGLYVCRNKDTWEVHSVKDENDRVRGIFFNDYDAINFILK